LDDDNFVRKRKFLLTAEWNMILLLDLKLVKLYFQISDTYKCQNINYC